MLTHFFPMFPFDPPKNIRKHISYMKKICSLKTTASSSTTLTLCSGWAFSGLLRDGEGLFGPPPKICHTYPTMMKLGIVIPYLRKIKKYINRVAHPLSSADIVGNKQILLHQEIQIQIELWYIISNSFNFSWVFNNCFNKHGCNFDDVSKNGYSRLS